jgi:hypothetical protein
VSHGSRALRTAPLTGGGERSIIAPVQIEGLPPELELNELRWQRKQELHVTAISRSAYAQARGGFDGWQHVAQLVVGRSVDPVRPLRELRVVHDPEHPGLSTVVLMLECPALPPLYAELRRRLGLALPLPPAHVTLYSTDPGEGIGLATEVELRELAPLPDPAAQEQLQRALHLGDLFG